MSMRIKIYQIDLNKDDKSVAFESYERLKDIQGSDKINAAIYNYVYSGEVDAQNLEDVYRIFNIDRPENYVGRSLSVSDVVEVVNSPSVKLGFYYCDAIGYKEIEFNPDECNCGCSDLSYLEMYLPIQCPTMRKETSLS